MNQTESPLTLTRFIEFFDKNIEPRFSKIDAAIHKVSKKMNQVDQQYPPTSGAGSGEIASQ